ncbi:hypothetical protein CDD80_5265 [Ophiocordyceps camponoti-rufipedis]|uniref:Uncharacterized protein n=1 Tax=Ophiocordyceps camponoti-rufipedis TaxID=2004952 RepID=A0A2C5ZHJ1_9HYPO|nr:hypothetical protein CDD80_5265 [Ophiocordyceps camponoti-rufipedis]
MRVQREDMKSMGDQPGQGCSDVEALITKCVLLLMGDLNSHDVTKVRDVSDGLEESIQLSLRNCEEVLCELEQFTSTQAEMKSGLYQVARQQTRLLDAVNSLSLAHTVRFRHVPSNSLINTLLLKLDSEKHGSAREQLQQLTNGLVSISDVLFESAGHICKPPKPHAHDRTFKAEEMDLRDRWSANPSTRRLICPKAAFAQEYRREVTIESFKLNCLCDSIEASHDSLLEYECIIQHFRQLRLETC